MLLVRIRDGITDHFPARKSEWALAGMLAAIGVVLWLPGQTFDNSKAYLGLARIATESHWAIGCFWVGFIRLVALGVNGTFQNSPYGRISPHVRALLAFASCLFWFTLALGLISASPPFEPGGVPLGVAIFPFLFFLDLASARHAAGEAKLIDVQKRAKNYGSP